MAPGFETLDSRCCQFETVRTEPTVTETGCQKACMSVCLSVCLYVFMWYRHTDIQTCRHTDIQTYRHPDIQTYRRTDIQTYGHTDIQGADGAPSWVPGSGSSAR